MTLLELTNVPALQAEVRALARERNAVRGLTRTQG